MRTAEPQRRIQLRAEFSSEIALRRVRIVEHVRIEPHVRQRDPRRQAERPEMETRV